MTRESVRFLKIARRSLNELGYGLHAACRLGYITNADLEEYRRKLQAIGGPLQGLINKRRLKFEPKMVGSVVFAVLAMSASLL